MEQKKPISFAGDRQQALDQARASRQVVIKQNRSEHAEHWKRQPTDECPDCLGRGEIYAEDEGKRAWTFKCERCQKTGKVAARRVGL